MFQLFVAPLTRVLYRIVLRPLFFLRDPEQVHEHMLKVGEWLGSRRFLTQLICYAWSYEHPFLVQNVRGRIYSNPVGLGAGFDKDGRLVSLLPALGFGFMEIGSVTGAPCDGNARPRLWRIKKAESILVHYGLKNEGAAAVSARLTPRVPDLNFVVGVSVAKTNCIATVSDEAGIADYCKAFLLMEPIANYLTINISCPNAYGGEPFTDVGRLGKLLTALDALPTQKPVFIKLPFGMSKEDLSAVVTLARAHRVQGFVSSNLAKDRVHLGSYVGELPTEGGYSGKPLFGVMLEQVRALARESRRDFSIIAVGGIRSGEDAYVCIRAGASLVQIVTALIYEGPQVVGEINRSLVQLLKRDGFSSISEAMGIDIDK